MQRLVRQMHIPSVMRIAIPQWQGRIAPVFDVAGHLLLVDVEDGREIRRAQRNLIRADASARTAELIACGVDLLICGAISAPLQLRIDGAGIRVAAFLCGAVDDVLAAVLNGTLAQPRFAMPGCHRWRSCEDVLPAGSASDLGVQTRQGQVSREPAPVQPTAARQPSHLVEPGSKPVGSAKTVQRSASPHPHGGSGRRSG